MSLIEYVTGLLKNETQMWQIDGRLFQSSAIRDIQPILDAGVKVVVDLSGRFDKSQLVDYIRAYIWWPIADKPELPNLKELGHVAWSALWWFNQGYSILIH